MKVNKYFLLHAWLVSLFFTALICSCWPTIRTYPFYEPDPSFAYRVGLFTGVVLRGFLILTPLFICLYLLYYVLAARLKFSGLLVKVLLFTICVVWLLLDSYSQNESLRFFPYYRVYLILIFWPFLFFKVYKHDLS